MKKNASRRAIVAAVSSPPPVSAGENTGVAGATEAGTALGTPPLQCPLRVGIGNDLHPLEPGRKLVLAGLEIPFDKGPVGHSDGDALSHAISDALLGAAALGDIGRHFPDSSPAWKGVPGLVFLQHVRTLLDSVSYEIVNIDATVGLERPKIAGHVPAIERSIAKALGIKPQQVSVKAKTGEGLGAVGRGEALRSDCIVLIVRRDSGQ